MIMKLICAKNLEHFEASTWIKKRFLIEREHKDKSWTFEYSQRGIYAINISNNNRMAMAAITPRRKKSWLLVQVSEHLI